LDKNSFLNALQEARKKAGKRNFSQTIELIISFKGINLKNADHQIDFFMQLKHPWKKLKFCGFVGAELVDQSKKVFDRTILVDDFGKYKNKREIKTLARENDIFIAQANLMPQVAAVFGRYLGPLGKMPNPKAGCVVPSNANLDALKDRISKMVNIKVKTVPVLQLGMGKEESKDEDIAEDALLIYDQLIHRLPGEVQNIKSMFFKLTMGGTARIK